LGKTIGKAKDLDDVERLLAENADAYIQFTLLKAAANIALGKSAEKAFEIQQQLISGISRTEIKPEGLGGIIGATKKLQEELDSLDRFDPKNFERIEELKKLIFEATTGTVRSGAIKPLQDEKKVFDEIFNELTKKSEELKKKYKFTDPTEDKDKGKSPLEKEIDLLKEIAETEGFSASKRLGALELFRTKKTELIKKTITDDEEELLRLTQLGNEFGDIFDKIFKWENNEQVTQDIMEVVDVTSEELLKLSEDSDEAIAALGEKVLEGVKNTSNLLFLESQRTALQIEDVYIDSFQNIVDTAGTLFSGIFDGQKNAIQEQIDEIDRLKAAEIDRINASGDNEEKKAARIKIIEAKAQSDKEALQKRQRQIAITQAIAERAFKAFQIIIDGQQAAAKIQNEILILKAKIASLGPAGLAVYGPSLGLAAASLVASRINTITGVISTLATPIPKFAKGKKRSDPYTGLGLVGEAGREIGIDDKGNMSLFTKPTITNLPKGTTILPNQVTEDLLRSATAAKLNAYSFTTTQSVNIGKEVSEAYEKGSNKVVNELKEIKKRTGIIIQNHADIMTNAYYLNQMKH